MTHPRRWVLLANSVRRNLHLFEMHGDSGGLLDLRDYVTTCWLLRATPKSTTVSAEKKQTDECHTSRWVWKQRQPERDASVSLRLTL